MGLCSWICCYCIIGKFNSIAIRKKITSSLYATNVWTLFEHRNRDEVFKAPFYQYLRLSKTVRFRSAALFFSLRFLWSQCLQESQSFFVLCIPFGGKDIIQKITALHLILRDAMPLFWSLHTFIEKWTWRESNPRPKTCPMYFYYHSQLFDIPSAVRKLTSLRVQ